MNSGDSVLSLLKSSYEKNVQKINSDFFDFLRFESVSSEPTYTKNMGQCAQWLKAYLQTTGLRVESWDTLGHPAIFASDVKEDPNKPTVLIYNHYDVQPVDPIEAWVSPPFEPTIREGEIYARGAQDNKGQCFYVVTAIKYYLEQFGSLPVNIKLLIEGEEEIGSPGLPALLESKRDELQADHLLIVDVGFEDPQVPAVTLGLRGLVTLTVEITGSNTDLHSGSHGGLAYNPNHALIELLAKLRDESGRILVPGFYDEVEDLSKEAFSQVSFDFDSNNYGKMFGAKANGGEREYSPRESAWLRPTLEVNGLGGGYSGAGFKTVIPATAIAKISCRLVPNQDPLKVGHLVAEFLRANCPDGLEVEATVHEGVGRAVRTSTESAVVQAASQAYTDVLGVPCQYALEGASIPIVVELAKASGAQVVLMGYAYPDDNIHAPNEHFGVNRLMEGFLTIARTLEILGTS